MQHIIRKQVLGWLMCPWKPHYHRWLITAVCVNNSRHESSGLSCVTASLLHPTCCLCATPQIHSHTALLLPSLPLMGGRALLIPFHAAHGSLQLTWAAEQSNVITWFECTFLLSAAGPEMTVDAVDEVCYIRQTIETGLAEQLCWALLIGVLNPICM